MVAIFVNDVGSLQFLVLYVLVEALELLVLISICANVLS